MDYGIRWPSSDNNGGLNFHGMFMSTGLVFFQGEALISYRLYRYDTKLLSKFVHVVFHMLAMAFFSTALAAMILQKNAHGWSHFTSVHSWIGIAVMFVFVVQFLFGFVNFLVPGISDDVRRRFLPVHRIVGSVSFAASIIQATIGFIQYNSEFDTCPKDHDAPLICDQYRFIFNFVIISEILYGISVLVLVILPTWRRKTADEMQ